MGGRGPGNMEMVGVLVVSLGVGQALSVGQGQAGASSRQWGGWEDWGQGQAGAV